MMITLTNSELISQALTYLYPRDLDHDNSAGGVACALLSGSGKLYFGVCMDIGSGIGFCAEHSAIAALITAGETRIAKIVAVAGGGVVLPPCGRCREFMYQINGANLLETDVVMSPAKSLKLRALLPHPYDEVWKD